MCVSFLVFVSCSIGPTVAGQDGLQGTLCVSDIFGPGHIVPFQVFRNVGVSMAVQILTDQLCCMDVASSEKDVMDRMCRNLHLLRAATAQREKARLVTRDVGRMMLLMRQCLAAVRPVKLVCS